MTALDEYKHKQHFATLREHRRTIETKLHTVDKIAHQPMAPEAADALFTDMVTSVMGQEFKADPTTRGASEKQQAAVLIDLGAEIQRYTRQKSGQVRPGPSPVAPRPSPMLEGG